VDEAIADSVRKRVLSAFPEGTFARIDVLGYGEDPAVEPGDIAVRVFIDRAGRPEESWDSGRWAASARIRPTPSFRNGGGRSTNSRVSSDRHYGQDGGRTQGW
jgi:hypothetical protein